MSLDELSLDSWEGGITSSEQISQQSEKQRESSRRAQAQLQKVQKDEKKAKTDNEDLFRILSRFIQNPLYSDLIWSITILLQENFPSRYLLFLIALVYPEASYYLLEKTGQSNFKQAVLTLHRYNEPTPLNDSIHPSLRDWITLWLTTGEQFITHWEASVVLVQKFSNLTSHSSSLEIAKNSLAQIFWFFFSEKNVVLSPESAKSYATFILSQLKTSVESSLLHMDQDLKEVKQIDERDLFGI
jgi:hypothetical protein